MGFLFNCVFIIINLLTVNNKARKEKNFPQMMKAWIRIVDTKSTIDADSFRLADIRPADYTTQSIAVIALLVPAATSLTQPL